MKSQNTPIGLRLSQHTSRKKFKLSMSRFKKKSRHRKYKCPVLKGRYFYVSRNVLEVEDSPTTDDAS